MKAKDRHRANLLEYLSNPDNEFCDRTSMALKILNFKNQQALYKSFTPDELTEIETEAFELRRKKYAPHIAKVDMALLRQAVSGDVAAAKLCYQRFENWSAKKAMVMSGPDSGPMEITEIPIRFVVPGEV